VNANRETGYKRLPSSRPIENVGSLVSGTVGRALQSTAQPPEVLVLQELPTSHVFWVRENDKDCLCIQYQKEAAAFQHASNTFMALKPTCEWCEIEKILQDCYSDSDFWNHAAVKAIPANATKIVYENTVCVGFGSRKADRMKATKLAFAIARVLDGSCSKPSCDASVQRLIDQARALKGGD